MRILVSIDDTDNIDSRGTGELASMIAGDLEKNGWGRSSFVTRHQLLVHPDIPYTSHNSAMCFTAEIDESDLTKIIDHTSDFASDEQVRLGEKVKTVLRDGQAVLLVAADEKDPDTRPWQTCSRQQLRNF